MAKKGITLLIFFIALITSCKKIINEISNPHDCCFPPVMFIGDTLNSLYNEMIFIPSGFTPNADGVNDDFEVYYSGGGGYYTNYKISIKIYLNNALVKDSTGYQPGWNGKLPSGKISQGVYRAEVIVMKAGVQYKKYTHYFWLLLNNANNKLNSKFKCLTFGDQYNPRSGVVYQTNEEFE